MKFRLAWLMAFLLVLLALVLAIRSCIHTLAEAPSKSLEQTAKAARALFRDFGGFEPEVVIHQTVVHAQSTSTTELALLQKETRHDYEWSHRWMGSMKMVRVKGNYQAKAGFDLREKFVIKLGSSPREVSVELPPARLLSIEQVGPLQFEGESGLWNRLSDEDRQAALNQAKESVRAEILASRFLSEVHAEAWKQLQALAEKHELVLIGATPSSVILELDKPARD
jgi:hypothetical protein